MNWLCQSLRTTLFFVDVTRTEDAYGLFKKVFGAAPQQATQVQPGPGVHTVGQHYGLTVTLQSLLGRVDLVLSPPQNDPAGNFAKIDFSYAADIARTTLASLLRSSSLTRLAVGVTATRRTESAEATAVAFREVTKIDVVKDGDTDLNFSVNSPAPLQGHSDITINRISRWSSVSSQVFTIAAGIDVPRFQVENWLLLETDHNNAPLTGPISPELEARILEELFALAAREHSHA